jgi:hypothetical protein
MSHIFQVACVRCGGIVHVPQATGVGACPRCQTPSYLQPQPYPQAGHGAQGYPSPQGPPAYGQAGNGHAYVHAGWPQGVPVAAYQQAAAQASPGQAHAQPAAPGPGHAPAGFSFPSPLGGKAINLGGMTKTKLVATVLALSLAGVGVATGKRFLKKKNTPGRSSIAALGIEDQTKVDPDRLIDAVRPLARKWKQDAEFRGINVSALRHDGTVDMNRATITVTFYSPSGVASLAKKQRDDSVKKFVFNDDYVTYSAVWGATKPWTDVEPTPRPGCSMKQVGALIPDGKEGHVVLDPNWGLAYHVAVDAPRVDTWIDIADCQPLDPGQEGDQE